MDQGPAAPLRAGYGVGDPGGVRGVRARLPPGLQV